MSFASKNAARFLYIAAEDLRLEMPDSPDWPFVLELDMAHLPGIDRSQMLLFPEAVEDYVGPDNPVRFIEAFVDGLDLKSAGFSRVTSKDTGRPGYDPADLLKIYIYGYLNRVRSSRRLETGAHRNIEVIWLLRHLKPDFRTIAAFRKINRSAFWQVFREFVVLCRQLDLFGRELLAVDGTRIKAVNNKDRNFTRGALTKFISEADEKLADYMKRLDESDADEEKVTSGNGSGRSDGKLSEKIAAIKGKRDRHKALLDELDKTGEDQISLTDPDARAMARMTKVGVGYNVQPAVDVRHKLIVEQEVCNQVLDMGLLAPTVEAAMETLGVDKIEAVADRGYFKISKPARRPASAPMFPNRSGGRPYARASSPRRRSATIRTRMSTSAQPNRFSRHAMRASHATTSNSTTATGTLARAAPSSHAAQTTPIAVSRDLRTRPSSIAWRHGWRRDLTFSTGGVKASSIRSGR